MKRKKVLSWSMGGAEIGRSLGRLNSIWNLPPQESEGLGPALLLCHRLIIIIQLGIHKVS